MPFLLRSVGALWAFLGISNIVGLPWAFIANDFTLHGLALNGGLFVIPGLALMRLAEAVERKSARALRDGERGIEGKRGQL